MGKDKKPAAGHLSREALALLILLAAAIFALGYFAGHSAGGGRFVVETAAGREAVPETVPPAPAPEESPPAEEAAAERINLNTADSDLLQTLPGIGEVLARRIIAYREEHGAFTLVDEIMDVYGIGERMFQEIRDLITVDDGGTGAENEDTRSG